MAKYLQAIRGMNDILPADIANWQQVESILGQVLNAYGYQEIRLPIVESTELFKRSIGEVTDIVEKEMYTFADRNGDSLTLRPEGTASCVRAGLQHSLFYGQNQRLWYLGPMFRHERPQRGRYRQFYQLGVEAYGLSTPAIDAELVLIGARIWRLLGIEQKISLQLNSLGSPETRQTYRQALITYLQQHELDEDSQRRLQTNPLRILDSKNPDMAEVISHAPILLDYLSESEQQYFASLQSLLDNAGVTFTINPHLVRGLDYYTDTVFEWVTDALGAQGTICAGGRYDNLVSQLGGKPTPAIGFALGLERLISLYAEQQQNTWQPDAYWVTQGDAAIAQSLLFNEQLHDALPNLRCLHDGGQGSLKSQFKRANKSGARYALILADNELADNKIGIKDLRNNEPQQNLDFRSLVCMFT